MSHAGAGHRSQYSHGHIGFARDAGSGEWIQSLLEVNAT